MMKYSIVSIVLFFFISCGETETIYQSDLKGTVAGYFNFYMQHPYDTIYDLSNILVSVDDPELSLSTFTDSVGYFELSDIPSGTYTFSFFKEGYALERRQCVKVVGGNEPIYLEALVLIKDKEITLDDVSMILQNDTIVVQGKVYHDFPIGVRYATPPDLMLKISSDDFSTAERFYFSDYSFDINTNDYTVLESGESFIYKVPLRVSNQYSTFTCKLYTYEPVGQYYDYTINSAIYTALYDSSEVFILNR